MHLIGRPSDIANRLKTKIKTTRVWGVMKPDPDELLETPIPTKLKRVGKGQLTAAYEYPTGTGNLYTPPELAKLFGMHSNTIRMHLKDGYTPEQIKNKEYDRKRRLGELVNGEVVFEWPVGSGEYLSVRQLAALSEIAYHTVYNRLRRGWSVARAIGVVNGSD